MAFPLLISASSSNPSLFCLAGARGRGAGVRRQVQRPSWGADADCHGGVRRRRGQPGANLGSRQHGISVEAALSALHRKQPVSAVEKRGCACVLGGYEWAPFVRV